MRRILGGDNQCFVTAITLLLLPSVSPFSSISSSLLLFLPYWSFNCHLTYTNAASNTTATTEATISTARTIFTEDNNCINCSKNCSFINASSSHNFSNNDNSNKSSNSYNFHNDNSAIIKNGTIITNTGNNSINSNSSSSKTVSGYHHHQQSQNTVIKNANLRFHRRSRSHTSNPPSPPAKQPQNQPLLCNNATIHQCHCGSNTEFLHYSQISTIKPCTELIQKDGLTAITILWPWHNLNKLYNNETYERFFKRQIANTVSRYCEKQANKCQGAYLRIDEANIVILKIVPIHERRMNITFVVIKNTQIRELTARRLMNSTRIRALLIQQKNELKRAFGGVAISSATISLTKLQNAVEDNTRLLTLVGLVGFFITVTYVVAAVKVCRDHYYKKLAKRRSVIRAVSENNIPDYGSCEETPRQKLQPINRIQNQINPSEMLDLDVAIPAPSPSSIDERSIQRMFECDPSQLPSEQPLWSRNVSLDEPFSESNRQIITKQKQNSGLKFPTDEISTANKELLANELQLNNDGDIMETSEYDNQNNKAFEITDKFNQKLTAEPRVIRSKTAHEIGNWSSDSEDEQNDVYYQLFEADDDETRLDENGKNLTDSNSDSDEPKKADHESSLDNTHSYQRLEESPTPVSKISESTTMV